MRHQEHIFFGFGSSAILGIFVKIFLKHIGVRVCYFWFFGHRFEEDLIEVFAGGG